MNFKIFLIPRKYHKIKDTLYTQKVSSNSRYFLHPEISLKLWYFLRPKWPLVKDTGSSGETPVQPELSWGPDCLDCLFGLFEEASALSAMAFYPKECWKLNFTTDLNQSSLDQHESAMILIPRFETGFQHTNISRLWINMHIVFKSSFAKACWAKLPASVLSKLKGGWHPGSNELPPGISKQGKKWGNKPTIQCERVGCLSEIGLSPYVQILQATCSNPVSGYTHVKANARWVCHLLSSSVRSADLNVFFISSTY